MKVFITGGAGFIGSHLAERLLARRDRGSHPRRSVDRLDREHRAPDRPARISITASAPSMDAPLVAELVDRCDFTIHLAAAVGVKLIVERPVHTIENNVHGTEVVLNAVARKQKPVLIASTSEVYGKSAKVPFSEEDDLVLGPTSHSRWAYACSKALDEWLGLAYAREKGVPVMVVRFFNTVGPRQTGRYGMVLPNFAAQALEGEPITVYGTGEQSRCFGHVRDAVEAVARLMRRPRRLERSSTSAVTRKSRSTSWRSRSGPRRAATHRSCTCPTSRRTQKDSRTCCAAYRCHEVGTHDRIQARDSLEKIIADVVSDLSAAYAAA